MNDARHLVRLLPVLGLLLLGALDAEAQNFRVQCPMSTPSHPDGNNIKCQQIAGGDGYATMGDGSTTYLFGFGPLSGLPDIYNGLPGTQVNTVFNTTFGPDTGTPSTLVGMPDGNFTFKGAIGLTEDYNLDPWAAGSGYLQGDTVRTAAGIYSATSAGTSGANTPTGIGTFFDGGVNWAYQGTLLDGHVDPRPIMDVGVMNANQPAPLIAIDEDDELFLTLSNVGHDHASRPVRTAHGPLPRLPERLRLLRRRAGRVDRHQRRRQLHATTTWHPMPARTSGIATSRRPSICRWAWWVSYTCGPRQNHVDVGCVLYTALSQWETAPAPISNPTKPSDWATYEPIRKRCGGTNGAANIPTDLLCSTPLPRTTGCDSRRPRTTMPTTTATARPTTTSNIRFRSTASTRTSISSA